MTINASDSAFPVVIESITSADRWESGLNKREYFIAKAMQGLCANPEAFRWTEETITRYAIGQADSVIKALKAESAKEAVKQAKDDGK